MQDYITVNCKNSHSASESIISAIKEAKQSGINKVVIPAINPITSSDIWEIDKTIYLPSDIEILIDGAHLRLADNTFINMFATKNIYDKSKEEQKNIKIHGINGAVLDGGKYNGLSERNHSKDGKPHITVNTMLYFYHTKNISVTDLKITNQRWWAITNIYVSYSEFKNIEFKADMSRVDENGVHHPDEYPRNYEEIYVKNADGIDLRIGCHHINKENITGFTEDDTVALTALCGFEKPLMIDGKPTDICHVNIKHIHSDPGTCAVLRLLWKDSNKLHDIYAEDIKDTRNHENWKCTNAVRIGDARYGTTPPSMGDAYNITVKDVYSKGKYGVSAVTYLKDVLIDGITVSGDTLPFVVLGYGDFENVVIKNFRQADNNN